MSTIPQLVGWSTNDRVPGYFGETVYGAGAISAASIPLVLVLVGTMLSTGTATPNQDVLPIIDAESADLFFGAGSEIARMCYAALDVPGLQIVGAPVAEAGGATAGVQVITLGGTWAVTGTLTFRVNGEVIQHTVQASDTPTTLATALVLTFNQDPRRPYLATSSGTQVFLTTRSKGLRANSYLTFQDVSHAPSGLTSVISGTVWVASATGKTVTAPQTFTVPTTANGYYYKATAITTGTTAGSEPTWPTTIGTTVVDGGVTWTCWGKVFNGGGTTWGGGAGTESAATLITILTPTPYTFIACAENDSTNLGRWNTFLNAQAAPTVGILEHFISGTNDNAQPTSLATTTMNSQRMALAWMNCGETAPWEMSTRIMAERTSATQADPAASMVFDDLKLPNVAPQSQGADRPSHAVKQAAINAGITLVYTDAGGANALILRGVTTHTLTGSTPDYRTLDWSDAYVPDFVRTDIGLFWTTSFKPNNPRVADNPSGDQKPAVSGVATPATWNAYVEGKLRNYEKGILATTSTPTSPTVAPIIIDVSNNLPTSIYDPIAKRIVSIIPVVPAPANHQIGCSIRQVSNS